MFGGKYLYQAWTTSSGKNSDVFRGRFRSPLLMVGVIGFEPTTPSPPAKCATKLRHTPTEARIILIALYNSTVILFLSAFYLPFI